MAKADQMITALTKLYAKRTALDKLIVAAEKKLVTESKKADKPARKPVVRGKRSVKAQKPGKAGRKPVAKGSKKAGIKPGRKPAKKVVAK